MSLRLRVTLAAGFAVLLAIVASSAAFYIGVREHLYHSIDASLSQLSAPLQASGQIQRIERALESGAPSQAAGLTPSQQGYLQFVGADGPVIARLTSTVLPVTPAVLSVARGQRNDVFFNASAADAPVRVYVVNVGHGTALEAGRSLSEVNATLRELLVVSAVVCIAGVILAAVIGRLVAAAALHPVRHLSAAVRAVADTGELSHHVDVVGRDEFSQVASGFNGMLDALSESLAQQRQLVADASHVLRTPLATVRTNVEVLRRSDELDVSDRAQLIRDTVAQVAELTRLVNNMIELARGREEKGAFGLLRLDQLAASVVDEARRNYPSVDFELAAVPSTVWGSPDRLSRAVSNLVDNAAKWTRPPAPVEIIVENRSVTVRDHGPGVGASDVPHIFDRFYRSLSASGVPGSGLGLAIAKQTAEAHGGTIVVQAADGGGAEFILQFPNRTGG
jgi:two-component system, OmpR family, sensor histidine kinase MprB